MCKIASRLWEQSLPAQDWALVPETVYDIATAHMAKASGVISVAYDHASYGWVVLRRIGQTYEILHTEKADAA